MPEQSDERTVAISDLANALQVAVPAAARLREHLDVQHHEAETLEDALTRAMTALRQLQPMNGGRE